jgi:hypothetical protein
MIPFNSIVGKIKKINYKFSQVAFNEPLDTFLRTMKIYLQNNMRCNHLHKAKEKSPFLSFLFNFIFTVGGFFLFLYLPAYKDASSSSSFLLLLLFVAVYLVIYGIDALFRSRWKKQVRLESDYQPQFSSEKGKG